MFRTAIASYFVFIAINEVVNRAEVNDLYLRLSQRK